MTHGEQPDFEELSRTACWALLRRTTVGRIALHGADDEIEIFPVNFIVDHGSIVFTTSSGTKLALADQNRPAAFEIDDLDVSDGVAWSVVLRGVPTVIRRHDDIVDAFDLQVRTWHAGRKPTYVRLVADAVTGRRFHVEPDTSATVT